MAADRLRTRGSVRTAVVWRSVRTLLVDLIDTTGREQLDVLDAGGGTGGFAVPLAELGHRVTVVDANPDSLAALVRRAADAGVTDRVRSIQGDVASLLDVVAPASFDLVVLHSVLEIVDDPAAALAAVAGVLRPGGVVSVVAANRIAAVLHRAAAGRFDEALHALRDPLGRYSATDPAPRRFALADLEALLGTAGFAVIATHGSRVFADLVPGGSLDADPAAVEALIALEFEASELPAFRGIATQLHVVGRRS
jgi:ubiquinone/menaquinone biosynthesis C-methylase UbiE